MCSLIEGQLYASAASRPRGQRAAGHVSPRGRPWQQTVKQRVVVIVDCKIRVTGSPFLCRRVISAMLTIRSQWRRCGTAATRESRWQLRFWSRDGDAYGRRRNAVFEHSVGCHAIGRTRVCRQGLTWDSNSKRDSKHCPASSFAHLLHKCMLDLIFTRWKLSWKLHRVQTLSMREMTSRKILHMGRADASMKMTISSTKETYGTCEKRRK